MSRQLAYAAGFFIFMAMMATFQKYFDLRFYLRFAGLFLFFYCVYTFVHAASTPSGTYYPFVERYLNFPILIRIAVLNVANAMLALLGYTTTLDGAQLISADGLNVLEMAWACYGMGVKSFWIAFVCAHSMPLKAKAKWSLIGVLTIFLLNCIRVITMMIAMVEKWTIADYLGTNAHDLFNYLCYAALLGLILIFYAKAKTSGGQGKSKKPVVLSNSGKSAVVQA